MSPSFWYGLGGAIMISCSLFLVGQGEIMLAIAGFVIGFHLVIRAVDIAKNS